MDNLTHSFCGWILTRAGLDRYGRWVLPTLIVAANSPDADILVSPFAGKAAYLLHHRGLTHSVVGLVVQAALISVVVRAYYHFRPSSHRPSILTVFAIAGIGLSSHLALDWLNSYGVRPWLPFATRWYYGDMAFIVDPWIWLILGGCIYAGSELSRTQKCLWALLAGSSTALIFRGASTGYVQWIVPLLWLFGLAFFFILRLKSVQSGTPPKYPVLARTGLVTLGLYALLLFGLSRSAEMRVRALAPESFARLSTHPMPGVPWRFRVITQTELTFDTYLVDVLAGSVQQESRLFPNLKDLALAQSCDTYSCCAWRAFARHPVVERTDKAMILGDLRYRVNPGGDWSALQIPLPPKTADTPAPK